MINDKITNEKLRELRIMLKFTVTMLERQHQIYIFFGGNRDKQKKHKLFLKAKKEADKTKPALNKILKILDDIKQTETKRIEAILN